MSAGGNGAPHDHAWVLHREDPGRSYQQPPPDDWDGDVDSLPYQQVTVRVFYCEICRLVQIDREYGDILVPLPRPPRPRRRWWQFW